MRVDERMTIKREIHFGNFISILLFCFARYNNIIKDSLKTQDSLLGELLQFLENGLVHERNVLEEWDTHRG
jgi:hypothetical protein